MPIVDKDGNPIVDLNDNPIVIDGEVTPGDFNPTWAAGANSVIQG